MARIAALAHAGRREQPQVAVRQAQGVADQGDEGPAVAVMEGLTGVLMVGWSSAPALAVVVRLMDAAGREHEA